MPAGGLKVPTPTGDALVCLDRCPGAWTGRSSEIISGWLREGREGTGATPKTMKIFSGAADGVDPRKGCAGPRTLGEGTGQLGDPRFVQGLETLRRSEVVG